MSKGTSPRLKDMIRDLSQRIRRRSQALESWIQTRLQDLGPAGLPVYSSVDLRNAGFKIAPVDTNLFPAGFNNLCETFSENASQAFRDFWGSHYPKVRKILILPEEHTRNLFYWKNVRALQQILQKANFEVEIGSASLELDGMTSVTVRKISLEGTTLRTADFVPDAILINNDLSTGVPEYLKNLSQVLLPSPSFGWYRRRKSTHFAIYTQLAQELGDLLKIDPWLLSPLTTVETGIDLADQICLERLKEAANQLLEAIRKKYREQGSSQEPYLFVKNNSGTYGLGVTHVDSGEALLKLNRRLRNKLEAAKGGMRVSEYLLQEGIPTADLHRGKPLEPVVYLVGGRTVGTFFRIHEERGERDNLNVPGMSFTCLCLHQYKNKDDLFEVASLLGRVATLAAAYELSPYSA